MARRGRSSDQPLLPARGLYEALWASELDLLVEAANDESKAKHDAAKAAWDAAISGIPWPRVRDKAAQQLVDWLLGLVDVFWRSVLRWPIKLEPALVSSSASFGALCAVFKEACARCSYAATKLQTGGDCFIAAIEAKQTAPSDQPSRQTFVARRLTLIEWWIDEACPKALGVFDPCGKSRDREDWANPLSVASALGDTGVMQLLLAKGLDCNGSFEEDVQSSPAFNAFRRGKTEALALLLDAGIDVHRLYACGSCVARFFIECAAPKGDLLHSSTEGGLELRKTLIQLLIDKRPHIVRDPGLLGCAFASGEVAIVDLVVAAGAQPTYTIRTQTKPSGKVVTFAATVVSALRSQDEALMSFALERMGLLNAEALAKYDAENIGQLAVMTAALAVASFPSLPGAPVDDLHMDYCGPTGKRHLDLLLATGYRNLWDQMGQNTLMCMLYPRAQGKISVPYLAETDSLFLLKTMHAAGFEVGHTFRSDAEAGRWAVSLVHNAAGAGHLSVIDWAIDFLGCEPEAGALLEEPEKTVSALFYALSCVQFTPAMHLLKSRKVRVSYPGNPATLQPLHKALSTEEFTDEQCDQLVAAIIERDPGLLTMPCYQGEAFVDNNPLLIGLVFKRTAAVVRLASSGLSRATELITMDSTVKEGDKPAESDSMRVTPAQFAAKLANWPCLTAFIQHGKVDVTRDNAHMPCVLDLVCDYMRRPGPRPRPIPRLLQTLLDKAAKKGHEAFRVNQRENARAGLTTNAFEDPEAATAPALSEKERKLKEKKKAAKKKARAPKREAARARGGGAGAAGAGGGDSDDSSGDEEPFEEPDDNLVDSRYAPSLDAMLAARGIVLSAEGGGPSPAAAEPQLQDGSKKASEGPGRGEGAHSE